MKQILYRNVRAEGNLELFLITAVSTVLLNRFFLYITGYPQIGGSKLHIAHMLWGGLLMLVTIVLNIAFLGERIRWLGVIIGGIGFGLFIDELGKFITKDNDYFFRPTIGLIYAIFVLMFLIFSSIGRARRLTDKEYELNALNQFEEAVLNDLDRSEKQRIYELLNRVENPTIVTRELRSMLKQIEAVPTPKPNRFERMLKTVDHAYARFWRHQAARNAIAIFFIVETVGFLATVVVAFFTDFNVSIGIGDDKDTYVNTLIICQFASAFAATVVAMVGVVKLRTSRIRAYELFRWATIINLLLSEFFLFSREQFGAIPSFILNLLLLIALRYAIYEERRHGSAKQR
jgi:hypothetical protein